jgi:hypothetical protein
VVFLPSNATSFCQPMDQGITKKVKELTFTTEFFISVLNYPKRDLNKAPRGYARKALLFQTTCSPSSLSLTKFRVCMSVTLSQDTNTGGSWVLRTTQKEKVRILKI